MTYLVKTGRPRAQMRQALGDSMFDYFKRDLLIRPDHILGDCFYGEINRAAPQLKKIQQFARMTTTGFWTLQQMMDARDASTALLSTAAEQLASASNSTTTAGEIKNDGNRIYREVWQKYIDVYLPAMLQAQKQGITTINAPGFHDWCADAMYAGYQLSTVANMLNCNQPFLATAIIAYQQKFDVVWGVVEKAGNVVAKAGETVLNVAEDLPQIWTVVKWGGLAAIAVAVAIKLGQMRRSS